MIVGQLVEIIELKPGQLWMWDSDEPYYEGIVVSLVLEVTGNLAKWRRWGKRGSWTYTENRTKLRVIEERGMKLVTRDET